MNRQEIQFAVKRNTRTVERIGRSSVPHPAIRYSGTGIKWFQDIKSEKKGGAPWQKTEQNICG